MIKNKKNITLNMFDVRPTEIADALALGKLENKPRIIRVKNKKNDPKKNQSCGKEEIIKPCFPKKQSPHYSTNNLFCNPETDKEMDNSYRRINKNKPANPSNLSAFENKPFSIKNFQTKKRPFLKKQLSYQGINKKINLFIQRKKTIPAYIKIEYPQNKNTQQKISDNCVKNPFFQSRKNNNEEGNKEKERKKEKITFEKFLSSFFFPKTAFNLTFSILLIFGIFYSIKFISFSYQEKNKILAKGKQAIGYLAEAKNQMIKRNFNEADFNIQNAEIELKEAEKSFNKIGGDIVSVLSELPFFSKIGTGKNLLKIGEEITEAAKIMNESAKILSQLSNPLNENKNENNLSLGETFLLINEKIIKLKENSTNIEKEMNEIQINELPLEYRTKFEQAKNNLSSIISIISKIEENNKIFQDILGYNGIRRYLFIFQNNQEMRATGGFIGSYGVLKMNNGEVEQLFIDGIYNPDGQLKEKVVPPKPIQKISAAWSTHDANWFPNFPTSAEKIAWFYEKTGGPTVDGIISLTPDVLKNLLKVTGPIKMEEYDVVIDENNFIEKTQYEIEIDYDRELNQPKKFIADLTPIILNKIFSVKNSTDLANTFSILTEAIKEKHILIYSFDYNIQKIVSQQGWSGEVLQTQKDYLMIINTNINGYKTDGVIDESVQHETNIQEDGSIINKVKIKRTHNGGHSNYEWWNKVNADYMRVYVPKGSHLLNAKGQTREFNQPPLDYDQLNFRKDPQVQEEEISMQIDEDSGTRVYDQDNKTVFANWVYVSPQETVEIEYEYLLPFKIDLDKNKDKTDSYSILFQKQSGSNGSKIDSKINIGKKIETIWKFPESIEIKDESVYYQDFLSQDRFIGLALKRK